MYNSNPVVILQAQQKNKIDDTINFIKNKPELTSKPIPTIASDSRALANIGNSDSDGNWCWIKADPTFMGLMQLLNEPVDRVFIGMRPKALEMLLVQPTKIIDAVVINKVEGSTLSEEWFGQEIVFNPELVAIIGNKGSGKSALADILGLLGNTPRYESFNFLHKDKFRKYPENKAGYFEASISWKDGNSDGPLVLDQNPKSFEMEKIKYIPQNYLEEICNEISTGEESKFYEEIQEVIFSHVPVPDRIKYSSLKELLNYRSEETRASIEYLMRDLQELNEQIIIYEEHLSDNYKKGLESKQAEKKKELDAYNNPSVKPKEEKPPQENPEILEKTKIISSELEKKQEEYKTILANIKALEAEDSLIAQRYAITDKILIRFQNVDRQLKKVIEETKSELISIGINQKEIFDYQFNAEPLEKKKIELQSRRNEISRKLDQKELGSLAYSLANLSSKIIELQSQLTEPQKKYQLYQKQYRAWDEKRLIIELSKREIDNQLVELNSIPKKLDDLIKERGRKTLEIFQEKRKLKDYYVSYYSGVHKFLNEDSIAKEKDFKLTFNVSIRENGFRDGFIKLINQRATGPFMGIQEGDGAIKKLVETANFDSEGDVTIFTNKILSEMKEYDGKKLNIEDQLAGKRTLRDLYDYIYSIQYLEPIYILKWDKKDLSQLSPGEKGNLLLIFYLLVDRDNIPLVIDQPEANLDNNTVFKTLVPCIKDAKKRRQIIIVTHNPNLAVVCDAEQIIHAQIEKEYKNKVTYTSGSIENLVINQCIVDVLEGTQPAFDNRDAKYIRERIHL
jgi:ABC-type lipoprotein export system ATPase subunit